MKEKPPLKLQGALLRGPRTCFWTELDRFHKNHCIGGPHNLVCPGAPTGLNPALIPDALAQTKILLQSAVSSTVNNEINFRPATRLSGRYTNEKRKQRFISNLLSGVKIQQLTRYIRDSETSIDFVQGPHGSRRAYERVKTLGFLTSYL